MTVPAAARPAGASPPAFSRFPTPTHSPERGAGWLTEGPEIALIARLMGVELMPWQQWVVDRATEYQIGHDGRRVYRYATVLVTVPRQSGKTTLVGPVQLHRVITRPGSKAFFTAQTGHAAGRRMQDLIQAVTGSPLTDVIVPRYQNGSEGFTVPGNGSSLRRFAPTEDAIHGETPALVTIDEIWKFTEAKGNALIGGISPAMITLHGSAQLWMISTRGTAQSGFMNGLVDRGRAGDDPSMAYFEWSLADGLDPYSPESWWTYHPALGNTITEAGLLDERRKLAGNPGEWVRAYCNRLSAADDPIVTPEGWAALADPTMTPPADLSALTIAYEVAPDNALSAVVAAWRDAGRPRTRIVHQAPGSAWVAGYVTARRDEWGCQIAADDGGPARRITAQLTAAGVPVRTLTMPERGTADLEWLAAARDTGDLSHDGSPAFAAAVAAAVLRTTNGVARVSRDHSAAAAAAVIASSVALFAGDYAEQPTEPQIW